MAGVQGDLVRERWGLAGLVSVAARMWLAATLADVGQFDEAIECAGMGLAIAEQADHPWSRAVSYMTMGLVQLSRGEHELAAPVLDRGIAFAREMDLGAWLPMLLCERGLVAARAGRADEGVRLLEEGVERGATLGILSGQAQRLTWLAEGLRLAGRGEKAVATAREAHRLASSQRERGHAAGALRMLGEALADPGEAAGHVGAALAEARALGMRPLEARCRLDLGLFAARMGQSDIGREHLHCAERLLDAMGMRYWLSAARSALLALPGSGSSRTIRNP